MQRRVLDSVTGLGLAVVAVFLFMGSAPPPGKHIITLRDFTKEEVKAVGLSVQKDLTVHVSAVGGGDKAFWRDLFDANTRSAPMFAAAWIIDANTRELVWEMRMDNTRGPSDHRACEEDVLLKKGKYEVYYSAHSFVRRSGMSYSSTNIDRRDEKKKKRGGMVIELFGSGNYDDLYDEFMDLVKDVYGVSIVVNDNDLGSVETFGAPLWGANPLVSFTGVGDNAYVRKGISLSKEVTVHLYAIGESRKRDEVFDYGWIVNSDTRERIWSMDWRNTRHGGGAEKNRRYEGELKLPKGNYEVCYATDGSHSRDDWNAMPPADPFNYGLTMTLAHESDRAAVKITDPRDQQNVIVSLTKVGDDEFKSSGFSLKSDARVHIYAIGEGHGDDELADFGWIVNAKTHEKVWTMERGETYAAGGDSKNRLCDEVITLSKGNYLVYYQTDDSHAYDDWNADPPYDQEHYGITISGAGSGFDPKIAATYEEGTEDGVIAQLVRVRDDRHERQRFTLDRVTKVRIYAVGEAEGDELADYGWIEDVKTGESTWEMTYRMTSAAGGAHKNRMVNRTITLDPGEYQLHFRTDDSHSFNNWNDDAPSDPMHWGITLYRTD